MNHENENSDIFSEIKSFLQREKPELPQSNVKGEKSRLITEIPNEILAFEPIPQEEYLMIISTQEYLAEKLSNMSQSYQSLDFMIDINDPQKKRIYLERFIDTTVNLGMNHRPSSTIPIEYKHYLNPSLNPLSQILELPITDTLTFFRIVDTGPENLSEKIDQLPKEDLNDFYPETTYAVHPKKPMMLKLLKLPSQLGDLRQDVYPTDTSGHSVFSEINKKDVTLVNSCFQYLQIDLHNFH